MKRYISFFVGFLFSYEYPKNDDCIFKKAPEK